MQFPSFRIFRHPLRRVRAIDCGAGHVAGAEFTRGADGRLRLQKFGIEALDPDPAGHARWAESTGGALGAIANREKMRGDCRLTLPGHFVLTKFVRVPAVEPARRSRIAEFEAQQGIPCPLTEIVWDHLCVAEDGEELELMLGAAKRSVIEPACAAAASAGFRSELVVPGPLALVRAFHYNYPEVDRQALVVSIGARSMQVVVIEGARFYARTAGFGGNRVTQFLAEELRLDFPTAEALKRRVLEGSPAATDDPARIDAVRRAAVRYMDILLIELLRSIAHCRPDGSAAQPAVVYLAGGGSLVPGLAKMLAMKLKVPVEPYDPLRHVEAAAWRQKHGPDSSTAVPPELIGLAVGPGLDDDPRFNLLPPERLADLRIRRRQPYLLASAILSVLALLPLFWHYSQVAKISGNNGAVLEQELIPLRALVAQNAGNLARLERAKARIAALEGPLKMKSSWIDFLGDLQDRLVEVEDVWLERLQVLPPSPISPATAAPLSPMRLALSGRLLDWNNPVSKVSSDSYRRAQTLLKSFGESEFVAAVEDERFDNTQPGILRFDCILVLDPKKPL